VWKDFPALSEMPINSAIASVQSAESSPPSILVKGYAIGEVEAVEVSADNGKTSHKSKLTYKEGPWTWTVWECVVPVEKEGEQQVVLWSRAVDKSGGKQPDQGEWNLRGLVYNGIGEWEGKVSV
jgi:sulfite oxidase